MFRDCVSLEHATLGAGINWLSESMFENCVELKSLTLKSKTLTMADGRALFGCGKLVKIDFAGKRAEWKKGTATPEGIAYNAWDYGTPAYTVSCSDGTVKK